MEERGRQNTNQAENPFQIKCTSCGGVMRYSPTKQNLTCIYCGSEKSLDLTPINIRSYAYDEWSHKNFQEETPDQMLEVHEVKCQQCGAVTTMPENVSSMKCPFCGNSLVLHRQQIRHIWRPSSILPFRIDEKQGMDAYRKWLSGKWFAPNKLRKCVADSASFNGVYSPFWAYDAQTHTLYSGKRGDEERIRDRDGKVHTIMKWSHVSGVVNYDCENLLIAGTRSKSANIASSFLDWDLENGVAYREEFVSGFVTELYSKDFMEGMDEASEKIEQAIQVLIKRDIGGDEQRIVSQETFYQNVMFKLLVLPIWISSYTYNGKVYQFIVNGRTGSVKGSYPRSPWKIAFVCLLVIAIVYLIYQMFMN